MMTTTHFFRRSRFPFSPRPMSSWGPRAILALGLAATLLLPSPGAAEAETAGEPNQDVRAKDLSLLETVLVESIQEAIETSVRAINAANRQPQPDPETGTSGELTYMFRTSGRTHARGMFLEGYGVIFTVQVPTLSYAPAVQVYVGSPDTGTVEYQLVTPDSFLAANLAGEIRIRSQIQLLERELAQLSRRLEEDAKNKALSERAREIEGVLAEIYRAYRETSSQVAEVQQETTEATTDERQRAVGGRRLPRADRRYSYVTAFDPQAMARAREAAEARKVDVEHAVKESVVDTLAQYGRIIHGLEANDRFAVILLPSAYLNQIQRWMRATDRPEEFVISVRYSDIQSLEEGRITDEEFRRRIRIESRLGEAREGLNGPSREPEG